MSKNPHATHFSPKFVSGSIMQHIWVMTSTSAIGLIGVFLVDLLDILFLSMLDSDAIIAGIGFAATLSFFTLSLSIGITISMAALVSRMIGLGDSKQARRYVVNVLVLAFLISALLALVIWLNLAELLTLLGGSGAPLEVAIRYLQILLPSFPVLTVGMAMSAALRSVGDAQLSMTTTLAGSGVNALLDPLFIFTLAMGVEGAAIASVIARVVILLMGFYGLSKKHQLIKSFIFRDFIDDIKPIMNVAAPAVLTNMATPLGNAIVIKAIAPFGAGYVAGFAIIGRVSMVAFGMVFALSGAIAPIFGQNFGARNFARIEQTLSEALKFNAAYVVMVSAVLLLGQSYISDLFQLQGDAKVLLSLFCTWLAVAFIFNGMQFVANSAFNNLGRPMYSTGFNIGRATLGTIPFVIIGAELAGAEGVLIGQAMGGMLFAIVAIVLAKRHIKRLMQENC